MRVALLSRSVHPLHAPGGMERAVFHLARHLRAAGIETLLLTRPGLGAGEFPGEVMAIPYRHLPGLAHGRVLDRTLNYPAFSRRLGAAAATLVRNRSVDLVHGHGLAAWGYAHLRERERDLCAPLVLNPHGMEEHRTRGLKRLALGRLRRFSRQAAQAADRVIATDDAMRVDVTRLLGVEPARIAVVPNGIDLDEIRAATPADPRRAVRSVLPELTDAAPLFLSVGRIERYKGFADLLAALVRLVNLERLPSRWAWVLVGEGPDRPSLSRKLQGLSALRAHVHLTGQVDETLLHALYARADVFVHASHAEGSSLVTLEAMAHSLPVIATRVGGIPDKVTPGRNGHLISPGDIQGLSDAMAMLGGDAELRRRMGEAGRERALSEFTWPILIQRTIRVYEELLSART